MQSVEEQLTKLEQVVFVDGTGETRKKDWRRTIQKRDCEIGAKRSCAGMRSTPEGS